MSELKHSDLAWDGDDHTFPDKTRRIYKLAKYGAFILGIWFETYEKEGKPWYSSSVFIGTGECEPFLDMGYGTITHIRIDRAWDQENVPLPDAIIGLKENVVSRMRVIEDAFHQHREGR